MYLLHLVGTRYHTHKNKSQLLPTIAVCSNGSEVELDIVFQNRISGAPVFQVVNYFFKKFQ